jgi:putative ABC transport system ATP-binding protein
MGMLDSPTDGSYVFNKQEVAGLSEANLADTRKATSASSSRAQPVDELSVRENVELALLYHNIPSNDRKSRVDRVLDKVGIAHRASIARPSCRAASSNARRGAPVGEPKLILADEPTGNPTRRMARGDGCFASSIRKARPSSW